MDSFGIHWIRPLWLLLVPLVWLAAWQLRSRSRAGGDWARVVDAHLLSWLSGSEAGSRRGLRWFLVAALISLALLALAGPSLQQRPSGSFTTQQARVVALDLSASMLAADVKPSRLAQARYKLSDLLDLVDEGQVGLVAYAGQPFVVSPLTSDMQTIANMVPALTPDIIPVAGSRADLALDQAAELITNAGAAGGEILLITDGVHPAALERAGALSQQGFRISVLAVGTTAGAPIPSGNGFLQGDDGAIVVSRLARDQLRALAREGGGYYQELRADNAELDRLLAAVDAEFIGDEEERGQRWQDLGYWLLLLLLPLAAFSFRRGWLMGLAPVAAPLLLASSLFPAAPAQAAGWKDLWQTPDQQAKAALERGDAEAAVPLAEDPAIAAEAHYRAGDYASAAHNWTGQDSADAHYNRGNALVQGGEYEAAVAAYDEALARQPDMDDALFNRALAEQLLEQQQQEQQDSEGEGEQSDSSEQSDEGQSSEQQSESGESSEQGEESEGDPSQDAEQQQEGEAQDQDSMSEAEQQQAQWSEEDEQAMEQWLRRIPDDPSGLLRRKFRYQHQRRGSPPDERQPW